MSISIPKLYCVAVLAVFTNNAIASNEAADITEISLEQLLNVEVFSTSKFNQKFNQKLKPGFKVNNTVAKTSELEISAQLLRLAKKVI